MIGEIYRGYGKETFAPMLMTRVYKELDDTDPPHQENRSCGQMCALHRMIPSIKH